MERRERRRHLTYAHIRRQIRKHLWWSFNHARWESKLDQERCERCAHAGRYKKFREGSCNCRRSTHGNPKVGNGMCGNGRGRGPQGHYRQPVHARGLWREAARLWLLDAEQDVDRLGSGYLL